MCLSFVVVAPVSWRVLFPERLDLRHGGVRLILYGAIGAGVVLSSAWSCRACSAWGTPS